MSEDNCVEIFKYIMAILFMFLFGFNIFFMQETRHVNNEMNSIKNITDIPYDLLGVNNDFTIVSLNVFFITSAFLILIQVVSCKNICFKYFMIFVIIIYFLIPSIHLNWIIDTYKYKKYVDIQLYMYSACSYMTFYLSYTICVLASLLIIKI